MRQKFRKNRLGQVWIETVIYTLIALVMIAAVLAIVKPKIEKIQDKTFIEQSIGMMKDIDTIIISLSQGGAGNKRLVELGIKKGSLEINSQNDSLIFGIDSSYAYSEPGKDIYQGNVLLHTRKKGDMYVINMTRAYSPNYNIVYQKTNETKTINKASTSYNLFISNEGKDSLNKTIINFEIK